jgi:hypothetical protein
MLCKPVDEQAELFQKPPAWSRGESSRIIQKPARKASKKSSYFLMA